MIQVTRLDHSPMVLNSDLIEHINTTPDTVISLTTGQTIMVLESADVIVERVISFRKAIMAGDCPLLRTPGRGEVTHG